MALDSSLIGNFQSLAEIAATLAGFSAIVGAIESRQSNALSTLRRSALHSLLANSINLIILCFAPIWFAYLFADQELVWRASFGVWLLLSAVALTVYYLSSRIDRSAIQDASVYVRIFTGSETLFFTTGMLLNVAALACILGYLKSYYVQIYFTLLIQTLLVACTGFIVLVTQRAEDDHAT